MDPISAQRKHDSEHPASRNLSRHSPALSNVGLTAAGTDDVIRALRKGLPFKALDTFASESGLTPARIANVIEIPERTFARRKAAGRLAPDESERLLRLSGIFVKAVDLFEGDRQAALAWLAAPKKAIGGHSPLEYLRFEAGAREVEDLIGRLEHGVFT